MVWSTLRSWLQGHEGQKSDRGQQRSSRKTARPTASRPSRFRPDVELLDRRDMLSTFTVINTNDASDGSLRWAITRANANPGADRIEFNIGGGGVRTIRLNSALPDITDQVTIDGYTQTGARKNTLDVGQGTDATLTVQITPARANAVADGLSVSSTATTTASGTVLTGLALYGFSRAITIAPVGATGGMPVAGVQVAGCFVGTDALTNPGGNGTGIRIGNSTGNTIGGPARGDRNLISSNRGDGIWLSSQSKGNFIQNNLVGTDRTGTGNAGANVVSGIRLDGSATTVGGATANLRNVFSGNHGVGLIIGGDNNVVQGNYIGTDVSGNKAVGNRDSGLLILGAKHTTVIDNVIGANGSDLDPKTAGIVIGAANGQFPATTTAVIGNHIGVGADGTTKLGNRNAGIIIGAYAINVAASAVDTTIGGLTDADRNVISGNAGSGILLSSGKTTTIQGNYIGTNAAGTAAVPNTSDGVVISSVMTAAPNTVGVTVGGTEDGARNVISGNGGAGIHTFSSNVQIQGNHIGVSADGLTGIRNGEDGVFVDNPKGGGPITVGGVNEAARNVISGHSSGDFSSGIHILNAAAGALVQGNYIGPNSAGEPVIGWSGNTMGVQIDGGADIQVLDNLISGNADGVNIANATNTKVAGNLIGLDALGTRGFGNGKAGVRVVSGINTTIGGTTAGERNVISGNGTGVFVMQEGSATILGNYIGLGTSGNTAVGNVGVGVLVWSNRVTIGGPAAGAGNVISGNAIGVSVQGFVTAAGVTIQGNHIGTNAAGTAPVGRQSAGVQTLYAYGVVIGGTVAGAGNVISGNSGSGVALTEGGDLLVAGNRIGTDKDGTTAVPNGTGKDPANTNSAGIAATGVTNLTIGGTAAGAGNVISGNQHNGITLRGGNNVKILGNSIGTTAGGQKTLGNLQRGIATLVVGSDTPGGKPKLKGLTIGGTTDAARNVISGNGLEGIWLQHVEKAAVLGNYLGVAVDGVTPLPNQDGIVVGSSTTNVTIGGAASGVGGKSAAGRNIISGNLNDGVVLLGDGNTVRGNFIGTDADGATPVPNGRHGVRIQSKNNKVGGTTAGTGNLISGNGADGVAVLRDDSSKSSANQIAGNYIGTEKDGVAALPNQGVGVSLAGDGGNVVQGNVISGNAHDGVRITSPNNLVKGGFIGTNAAGTMAVPNGGAGVHVAGGSTNAVGVISTDDNDRNIISGNGSAGVLVENATGTTIVHNYVGSDKAGMNPVGNGAGGVIVSTGAVNTTIGGTAANAGNLVSGNTGVNGVQVQGNAGVTLIQGNRIGLSRSGKAPLANQRGIVVQDTAAGTTIGGTASGAGNVISFNDLSGINVVGRPAKTLIRGNRIGLDVNGGGAPNLKNGITIQGGKDTTVGGSPAGANVVSGNNGNGIAVSGADVLGITTISDNLIGTNPDGTAARANGMAGVLIADATASLRVNVGGNVISGNAGEGVFITTSPRVAVGDNIIGLNKLGTAALPNGSHGVLLDDAADCIIGLEGGNVISGNMGDGIRVGGGSTGTQIYSNTIGLRKGGAQEEANAGNGVNVTDTANNTTVGGATAEGVNIISGNDGHGINLDVNTVKTQVLSNNIGLGAGQTVGLGNGGDGVHVLGKGVKILGNLKEANHVIAGNAGNGIQVSGANASGTIVEGFRIGTNGAGTDEVANGADGILVTTGADDVRIGGPEQGHNLAGNLVSGNTKNGIEVANAAGTLIQGNLVGTDLSGDRAPLGNSLAGVLLRGTNSVTVGGNATLKNTVSANGQSGIVVSDAASTTIGSNNIGATSGNGMFPMGNAGDGVFVTGSSKDTTINANRIAANTGSGVNFGANASGLSLTGNFIGPAAATLRPANRTGVLVNGQNVTIGGTAAGQANTIFANATAGIDVEATARNVNIQGNFIGTTQGNLSNGGNGTDGILVKGLAAVTIGGTTAGARNVISGNKGNGIHLTNVTQAVKIEGNLIGTNIQGTHDIGNARDGVFLEASSNALIQGNTISGNGNGVELSKGSSSNTITANKIGVGLDGVKALGNKGFGVWVHQGDGAASNGNTIGGTASDAGNLIGYNAKGVVIGDSLTDSSQQNAILGNPIFKSLILIDLGNNGPTYTPSGTAGPNRLEVPPTLTSATVGGSDLTATGTLKGTLAKTTYRIEIFAADPTVGPFKRFLGFKNVTTNGSGNVVDGFSVTFQGVAVRKGAAISATATDANGNTTGFAAAITAS